MAPWTRVLFFFEALVCWALALVFFRLQGPDPGAWACGTTALLYGAGCVLGVLALSEYPPRTGD